MGKTKTKIIDDSIQPETDKKSKKKLGRQTSESAGQTYKSSSQKDELVEKLKAELGGEEVSPTVIATPSEARGKQSVSEEEIASSPSTPRNDAVQSTKKPQTSGKAKPRSKKYQEVSKDLDRSKSYPLSEALDMVKKLSYSKFNATLEAHINTTALGIRGLVSLPFASGKKLRILVFGKGADSSGADIFGSDEVIEQINKGKIDFDLVITTAEWMPKLAKVARILGPRGLMPNPKNGTITEDTKKAVEGFQAGKTEYKTESKAAVIHLGLGKLTQPNAELSANIKTLLQTVGKTRVKKVSLSPTMGPSVKIDLASV